MLNFEKYNSVFAIDEKNNTRRNSLDEFRLFPFTTNKDYMVDFYLVLGSILRNAYNLNVIKNKITIETLNTYTSLILKKLDDGAISNNDLSSILKDLYFTDGVLNKNTSVLLKYAESNSVVAKTSLYLRDVLFYNMEDALKQVVENENKNVLDSLFYSSLDELDIADTKEKEYYNFCPLITNEFQKDIDYLINDKEFSIDNLVKLLEFYYFMYTSQSIIKIDKRLNGDKEKIEEIYFALDWERISSHRKCVSFGYNVLKTSIDNLFMNVVLMQILNCSDEQDYKAKDYFLLSKDYESLSIEEKDIYKTTLLTIFKDYREKVKPEGQVFKPSVDEHNSFSDIVECMFDYIKFQVSNSERRAPARRYANEFRQSVESAFVKFRGKLGQSFNITDDYLIFITKICIKNNDRMRLNDLFCEFEKHGLFFDTTSKDLIVKYYEKLNILDKKSDSGVVQYVKRI